MRLLAIKDIANNEMVHPTIGGTALAAGLPISSAAEQPSSPVSAGTGVSRTC